MWRSGRPDTFVAVAEKLRFGRAAARLHVSQPPLPQAILALERELGVQRLHRNSRQVSLTQTGDVLLRHCRHRVRDADRAPRRGAAEVCGGSPEYARQLGYPWPQRRRVGTRGHRTSARTAQGWNTASSPVGPIFSPSAQALNLVWPGVLPGLPPVHVFAVAGRRPPVDGEPPQAVRLRRRMTEQIPRRGYSLSAPVLEAMRSVPRHRYAPEVPLETAYDDDLAVVALRNEEGRAVSSVSASWLQGIMIGGLCPQPGMTMLEVGSGGFNAELLAHVVGRRGRVVTVDLDPYVVHRTQQLTAEAGSGRVTAILGDGTLGASDHIPADGFDGTVITYNVWDVSTARHEQLAEGGYLVLPLEMHGYPANAGPGSEPTPRALIGVGGLRGCAHGSARSGGSSLGRGFPTVAGRRQGDAMNGMAELIERQIAFAEAGSAPSPPDVGRGALV